MTEELTRDGWIYEMEQALARTMPDMFPAGYARFEAESRANEGGYDDFMAGKFKPGYLWEPKHD